MKNIILIFIFSIGFISCSNNDETKIDNSVLIGKWNWTGTGGGIGGHIQDTPTSTNSTIQINFTKNYLYTINKNGIEVSSGKYELVMEKSIYSVEKEKFIICYESKNQEVQYVLLSGIIKVYEKNIMNILDNTFDGVGSSYVKIE